MLFWLWLFFFFQRACLLGVVVRVWSYGLLLIVCCCAAFSNFHYKKQEEKNKV
jgi:Ca2+/Na+ antiporter